MVRDRQGPLILSGKRQPGSLINKFQGFIVRADRPKAVWLVRLSYMPLVRLSYIILPILI
jgi:hypothetical protein